MKFSKIKYFDFRNVKFSVNVTSEKKLKLTPNYIIIAYLIFLKFGSD